MKKCMLGGGGMPSQEASPSRPNAEMGAAYVCAEAGISKVVIANQPAYIAGWLSKCRARHFFSNQQESVM